MDTTALFACRMPHVCSFKCNSVEFRLALSEVEPSFRHRKGNTQQVTVVERPEVPDVLHVLEPARRPGLNHNLPYLDHPAAQGLHDVGSERAHPRIVTRLG